MYIFLCIYIFFKYRYIYHQKYIYLQYIYIFLLYLVICNLLTPSLFQKKKNTALDSAPLAFASWHFRSRHWHFLSHAPAKFRHVGGHPGDVQNFLNRKQKNDSWENRDHDIVILYEQPKTMHPFSGKSHKFTIHLHWVIPRKIGVFLCCWNTLGCCLMVMMIR